MEGVESKKITTKFDNKGKFCIRAGSMTARKYAVNALNISCWLHNHHDYTTTMAA